ncbi:glycoside hydrolase family 172 protein [Bacillus sp. SD088]|uniref:glycoside hydrolase family 172 protein n=1 Tax=Bacillus sp. SD088 TaxID=2782012 RepID=UPI001A97A976|nr:glycoside hydrolase family 172 protein [Bacillus sp. SD088]MBO0994915.1 DUF2961 domain-containing protein [Bacillus sp. SD088]
MGTTSLSYRDLVKKLYDLSALSVPPMVGEKSGSFSSYDRSSKYSEETNLYENWGANDDGSGYIRKEGDSIVALELDGPGVIWRVWSAHPGDGHIRIFIDEENTSVLDKPFKDYFDSFGDELLNFPSLNPTLSRGRNSYIPIPFQKSCKIVLDKDWGNYYHFTYTQFPKEVRVPSFNGEFDKEAAIALAEADRILYLRGRASVNRYENENQQRVKVTVPPGEKAVIFNKHISGAITMIRANIDIETMGEVDKKRILRELVISMEWDGEQSPSVWAPLGDFFGSAPGVNTYSSLPLGMHESSFYSNWYMPFSEGANIEIANDGTVSQTVNFEINYIDLPKSKTKNLLRFHAKWHRDDFQYLNKGRFTEGGDRWPDWPLLLVKGKGRYCGVHLHVYNTWEEPEQSADTWWYGRWDRKTIDWWWGEGDEKFFIDGEKFPSTFGTGSEDYIGYAWAAEPPFPMFDSAFACQPFIEIDANGHTSVNRFHVCDNIPFNESFEGFIEKYKDNRWENNNVCIYATTVYWYQSAGTSDIYEPVSVNERVGYSDF